MGALSALEFRTPNSEFRLPNTFAGKSILLTKIKVAAVSYLNTKPLLWGIERSPVMDEIELLLDYPSNLAVSLMEGKIDMALLPVAAMPGIPGARIVGDYGIAADGEVASVCIFSKQPIEEVTAIYLDYQSRSSVRLATLLLKTHWKKEVELLPAPTDYIDHIGGNTAGVIIGDRALEQRHNFPYIYDLAQIWKDWTGLPFVFAAWVANKDLPADFIQRFNAANAEGLKHIDEVVAANPFPLYDLQTYYRHNIDYHLDGQKLMGLEAFLELIADK
jgi:chorismate dehydratase